jgi:two-component system, NarL family, sensor kinase
VTRSLHLDGRNIPVRAAAFARLAMIPLLPLFEMLSAHHERGDAWFADPLFAILIVYAVGAAAYAFLARRDVPLAPFAIIDLVLLAFITWGENDPTPDVRFMLFVPVLVAVLSGPRLTLAAGTLSVAAYVIGEALRPGPGAHTDAGLVASHTLALSWRAGLAVVVAVLLDRRAERIRRLAESRRSLATQALHAEARARRELSYVLHDELVQQLLCAQQDLKEARRGRPEYVDRAETVLAGAVRQLRQEIFRLHPHVLETAGLEAALAAVAGDQADGGAERPVVSVAPDATGFDEELLFSLGRELMTNAARHADARHVELTVRRSGDAIVLRCRDDGRGMAPGRRGAALAGGHLGLAACTERVEALGGSLEIVTAPGAGTDVRATIPAPIAAAVAGKPAAAGRAVALAPLAAEA